MRKKRNRLGRALAGEALAAGHRVWICPRRSEVSCSGNNGVGTAHHLNKHRLNDWDVLLIEWREWLMIWRVRPAITLIMSPTTKAYSAEKPDLTR